MSITKEVEGMGGLRKASAVAAAGVLGVGLAAAPTLGAAPQSASVTPVTITVKAYDFGFKLSKMTVKHGTPVIFKYSNTGKVIHDFAFVKNTSFIKGKAKKTPLKQPKGTATLTVTFSKAAKYEFICTVPRHRENGMDGKFTVT